MTQKQITKIVLGCATLLFALNSWSLDFSSSKGDYAIAGCIESAKNSPVNYCNYDEVKISTVPGNATETQFEFFKQGTSSLKFTIKSVTSENQILSVNLDSQKISLISEDDGIDSETSIEPYYGSGKLLKFSSTAANALYTYWLYLKSK